MRIFGFGRLWCMRFSQSKYVDSIQASSLPGASVVYGTATYSLYLRQLPLLSAIQENLLWVKVLMALKCNHNPLDQVRCLSLQPWYSRLKLCVLLRDLFTVLELISDILACDVFICKPNQCFNMHVLVEGWKVISNTARWKNGVLVYFACDCFVCSWI